MSRNIKTGIVVAVISGLALIFFAYTHKGKITNYPPQNSIIVAFGDSLVEGYGATEENDFVSVLGKKLGRNIVNLGIRGNTTADGLERIDDLLGMNPGIVIVLLGGNDFIRRVPIKTTQENLSLIIEKIQQQGAVVVLLGVRSNLLSDSRKTMYEKLSTTYGTVYMEDVLDGIFLKPDLMFDGIHPNDAGYQIIADRLYKIFIQKKL